MPRPVLADFCLRIVVLMWAGNTIPASVRQAEARHLH